MNGKESDIKLTLKPFQPLFAGLRIRPNYQGYSNYTCYQEYCTQCIHNESILYVYFNILFAKFANINVENTPNKIVIQFISFEVFVNNGVIPPKTSAANINFDKSKKYPASFSRLTLSFSFTTFFPSCCFSQFPIPKAFSCF